MKTLYAIFVKNYHNYEIHKNYPLLFIFIDLYSL